MEKKYYTNRPDLEDRFNTITIRRDGNPDEARDITIGQLLCKFDNDKQRLDVLFTMAKLAGINPYDT